MRPPLPKSYGFGEAAPKYPQGGREGGVGFGPGYSFFFRYAYRILSPPDDTNSFQLEKISSPNPRPEGDRADLERGDPTPMSGGRLPGTSALSGTGPNEVHIWRGKREKVSPLTGCEFVSWKRKEHTIGKK